MRSQLKTKRSHAPRVATLVLAALVATVALMSPARAQAADGFVQQGPKLVPSDENGASVFGSSVAVSADGNTALIGGYRDHLFVGATWVFERSGGGWAQRAKLTATAGTENGQGQFGKSVTLSANGNTALIGGPADNSHAGAAWVFTRSGDVWTQQTKLTAAAGTETGPGSFGASVALSADGNAALIGGPGDNSDAGAIWVFTRSGATWTQQAAFDVTGQGGEVGAGGFGASVALSADGNLALAGAPGNNGGVGAAWMFTRSGGVFTQLPEITAASGSESGAGNFGSGVTLAGDGNTALIGGLIDNGGVGAAWAFTRSGATVTQQAKLTAAPGTEAPQSEFGVSVALSGDGSSALVGGPYANLNHSPGAAWAFTHTGSTWTQQGGALAPSDETGKGDFGISAALSADGSTALIGGALDNGAVGAAWSFELSRTLAVSLAGAGAGTIAGPGIACPGNCSHAYPSGTGVTLSATPAAGSSFAGWTGACTGTGPCSVTMSADQAVTATFTTLPPVAQSTTPPVARITKAKINRTHHTAKFTFKATGMATGFQCALLRTGKTPKRKKRPKPHFTGCKSPKLYKHLKSGKYTFELRALSPAGAGPVTTRRFTI